MPANPRNLVVICIDGRTMHNLATNGLEPDSVPVPGAFDFINYLVSTCVGNENVCLIFTNVDNHACKQAIDAWLTEHKLFKKTGLLYRIRNIVYPSLDETDTVANYVRTYLDRHHRHFLVISDSWTTLCEFVSDTNKSFTRVLFNPTPNEEVKYRYSAGTWLLRDWNDIRALLLEVLRF